MINIEFCPFSFLILLSKEKIVFAGEAFVNNFKMKLSILNVEQQSAKAKLQTQGKSKEMLTTLQAYDLTEHKGYRFILGVWSSKMAKHCDSSVRLHGFWVVGNNLWPGYILSEYVVDGGWKRCKPSTPCHSRLHTSCRENNQRGHHQKLFKTEITVKLLW